MALKSHIDFRMETAIKLDVITIEDQHNLSNSEIFQRANEIAQLRGFENGWEISEIRPSGPFHKANGLNIWRFDVFGFEASKTSSKNNERRSSDERPFKSVAAPQSEV